MSTSAPRFTLYVKPGCPWCDEAVDWLEEGGYAFDEVDVTSDPAAYAEMRRLSGQTRCPTITGDGELLPDFDVDQLVKWLTDHGWKK